MLINLKGRRLYYDLTGPENGPVVCFAHSLSSDGGMWAEQMAPLVGSGYRILRLDMRGHGGSDPVAGDYTMAALADDVAAALDFLQITKVHFIGLSIGGMLGQAFAREAGTLVDMQVTGHDAASDLTHLSSPLGPVRLAGPVAPPHTQLRVVIKSTDVMLATEEPRGISALNSFTGVVSAIVVGAGASADVTVQWPDGSSTTYTALDATLTWCAGKSTEFQLGGTNLLRPPTVEFLPDLVLATATRVERRVFLRWRQSF